MNGSCSAAREGKKREGNSPRFFVFFFPLVEAPTPIQRRKKKDPRAIESYHLPLERSRKEERKKKERKSATSLFGGGGKRKERRSLYHFHSKESI